MGLAVGKRDHDHITVPKHGFVLGLGSFYRIDICHFSILLASSLGDDLITVKVGL